MKKGRKLDGRRDAVVNAFITPLRWEICMTELRGHGQNALQCTRFLQSRSFFRMTHSSLINSLITSKLLQNHSSIPNRRPKSVRRRVTIRAEQ